MGLGETWGKEGAKEREKVYDLCMSDPWSFRRAEYSSEWLPLKAEAVDLE